MRSLLCLFLLSLSACGQKGPLYLPAETPVEVPAQSPEAGTLPAEEAKKDSQGNSRP